MAVKMYVLIVKYNIIDKSFHILCIHVCVYVPANEKMYKHVCNALCMYICENMRHLVGWGVELRILI